MTDLNITPTVREGLRVLLVEGEVDASSVDTLASALADQQHDLPTVADLSLLTFIDSSGLHALSKAAGAGRLDAVVRVPNSSISRVFDIIKLDKIVPVFDDLPTAISDVNERAA